MGGALLKGWIREGIGPLIIVELSPSPHLRSLCRVHGISLTSTPESVSGKLRACVIALKPQILAGEASRLKPIAQSGALMISIAAGTTIRKLSTAWGRGSRIVRAMPNTPGAIGKGISALFANRGASSADCRLAENLLSPLGQTLWLSRESLLDSVTAVSGSGPAYVFLLAEALEDAAVAEGLPRNAARQLARATVSGAGGLLDSDARPAADLRKDVTSPNGTTQAALDVLMAEKGLKALLAKAVHAARERAEELGR